MNYVFNLTVLSVTHLLTSTQQSQLTPEITVHPSAGLTATIQEYTRNKLVRSKERDSKEMPDIYRDDVLLRQGDIVLQEIVCSPEKPRSLDIIERIGGEIRSGSLEYFFNHVLPPMKPELDVDRVYNSCVKGKILYKKRGSKEYTWKGVRKNSRGTSTHKTWFVNIFRAITRMVKRDISANTSSGVTSTRFDILDNSSEVGSGNDASGSQDNFIYLENTLESLPGCSEEERLCNTSFTFNLKSSNSNNEVYDNIQCVLHRLMTTMHKDPCRRFVLGATIEDTSVRLWFCNRAMIIASEQFDINRDAETLIKLILCLGFADKVDMGWDLTMSSDYKNNDRIFDIEICGNHYRTSSSNIVFQYDDIKMCSSATRIYKAFRVDDVEEKENLIIKDYWPTELLDTEDIILKEMLNDITDPLERELVERSILTPISCERVKVNDREDHTKETILRGESPNMSYKIILPEERGEKGTFILRGPDSFIDLVPTSPSDDSMDSLSLDDGTHSPFSDDRTKSLSPVKITQLSPLADNTKSPSLDDNTKSPSLNDNTKSPFANNSTNYSFLKRTESPSSSDLVIREILPVDGNVNRKRYVHRWHCRIVYKQVAIPYEDLRDLKDMVLVLEHALRALQLIHKAGWVHRDLSAGNLYLYIDPVSGVKRGLIGDFEFAKKVGSGGRHEKRIGTPFFTSSEIIMGEYQYMTTGVSSPRINEMLKRGRLPRIGKLGFWANYLHDLESLWWVIIYTMTHFLKTDDPGSKPVVDKFEKREENEIFRSIFSNPTYPQEREKFLSTDIFFDYMHEFSKSFPKMWYIAKFMRARLVDAYREREYNLNETKPILILDGCTLHKEILQDMQDAQQHPCQDVDVDIIPMWKVHSNNANNASKTKQSSSEKTVDLRGIEGDIGAKGELVVDVADDTTSQRIVSKRKRKRKEDPQDIDNEVSRPMTRSRVALLDTNRRITRSMTKAMLNAKSLCDGRDTTQTKTVRSQGAESGRKRTTRNRRK